jgi:hypothetical protein
MAEMKQETGKVTTSAPQTAVEHLKAAAEILEAKDSRNRAVKTFHSAAADIRRLIAVLESRGGA